MCFSMLMHLQVEEMAIKLDNLLEGIEGKGGFRDASITSQETYVVEMEEGIWALSDKCRMWKVLFSFFAYFTRNLLDFSGDLSSRFPHLVDFFMQRDLLE